MYQLIDKIFAYYFTVSRLLPVIPRFFHHSSKLVASSNPLAL